MSLGTKILIHLHMVNMGTSSYKAKTTLTSYINSYSNITPRSLIDFKLSIFTFFFLWLLIYIFLTKKTYWISKVEVKWDANIPVLLDWLYKISALVIIHSLSLADGLEFIDALKIGV